ncbi:hypothetical protein CYMTET_53326, partial [Cymbomonas tetramitiformis]
MSLRDLQIEQQQKNPKVHKFCTVLDVVSLTSDGRGRFAAFTLADGSTEVHCLALPNLKPLTFINASQVCFINLKERATRGTPDGSGSARTRTTLVLLATWSDLRGQHTSLRAWECNSAAGASPFSPVPLSVHDAGPRSHGGLGTSLPPRPSHIASLPVPHLLTTSLVGTVNFFSLAPKGERTVWLWSAARGRDGVLHLRPQGVMSGACACHAQLLLPRHLLLGRMGEVSILELKDLTRLWWNLECRAHIFDPRKAPLSRRSLFLAQAQASAVCKGAEHEHPAAVAVQLPGPGATYGAI